MSTKIAVSAIRWGFKEQVKKKATVTPVAGAPTAEEIER